MSRRFQVHQVLATLGYGVAIGHEVLGIQRVLRSAGFDPVVASTWGALAGATLIYLLHYYLTFSSGKKHREAAIRFSLVAGGGLFLNATVLSTVINLLGWSLGPAQVLATLNQFWVGYTVNRRWTF